MSFNALEHTANPKEFLCGIADLLKPEGKALICIPDVTNAFNRGDLNELMHEHIAYFTPATFETLAACSGLSVESMKSEDDTLWAVVVPGRQTKDMLIRLPELFHDLQDRFLSPVARMKNSIKNVLSIGKKVGFHGATNGLCNFLYLSGLSPERQLYIFDADESKHGHYLPGSPNPIASPYSQQYSEVETMYVSAMTYYETISQFAQSNSSLKANQVRPLFE